MTEQTKSLAYESVGYQPGQIANYMLEKADSEGVPISPMKLQKLIYNAYGWILAILHRKLFEERIQAWKYGPVVPSLYHELKHFGWSPIEGRCVRFRPFTPGHEYPEPLELPTHEKDCAMLNTVWNVYKHFTASDLSVQTHDKETPWHMARYPNGKDGGSPTGDADTNDDDIRKYFKDMIDRYLRQMS